MFFTAAKIPMDSCFVGRQQELEFLNLYTKERGSCVAVTGVGGIGKTALLRTFESKASKNFPGGIYHLSGLDGFTGVQRNLENISKDEGHSLVVLDDVELLNTSELVRVYDTVVHQSLSSLVLSGRLIPISKLPNTKILTLSGLNTTDLVKARLKLVPERTDIDKALKIIDGNAALFNLLLSTPRDVLNIFYESIAAQTEVSPEVPTTHIHNLKVNVQLEKDKSIDLVSILIAIILFIASSKDSSETEARIINEINNIAPNQTHTDFQKYSNSKHYVTKSVNFRSSPLVQKDNVITVLSPNQIISVLSVSEGWAKVIYTDHISSIKYDGWIYSKYMKPIYEAN